MPCLQHVSERDSFPSRFPHGKPRSVKNLTSELVGGLLLILPKMRQSVNIELGMILDLALVVRTEAEVFNELMGHFWSTITLEFTFGLLFTQIFIIFFGILRLPGRKTPSNDNAFRSSRYK